jgi:hypothetical protein
LTAQTRADRLRGQIGFLRTAREEIEPITRDTNDYRNLSISADGANGQDASSVKIERWSRKQMNLTTGVL